MGARIRDALAAHLDRVAIVLIIHERQVPLGHSTPCGLNCAEMLYGTLCMIEVTQKAMPQ